MRFLRLALVSALLLSAASTAHAATKPNFIVINIDDLGYADIGPYGSMLNRTPNLDRMAKEGRKLTSFYAAPVCSPSRASLMTGSYPKRALPIPHVLFPGNEEGLHPNEVTVAEVLKGAGYATGIVGKWHLGDQPEYLPMKQGFDHWYGLPYSNDMGPVGDGIKSDLGKPLPEPKGNPQPPLPLMRNDTVVTRVRPDDQQALVENYTTEAVKFIRANSDRPFFLYLPHSAVHFPLYPGKQWAGKSPNGLYSDWVEEVDWSVGRVLDTVRELKLDSKTLVIFTSDNGGTARGLNTPLRGNKGSTWEGGIRVCTIAWWLGTVPAGTSTDAITGMFDVLPTLAGLAGAKLPAGRKLDGIDIWPVIAGAKDARGHEEFLYYRGLNLQAVRSGPWKLHLPGANAPQPKKNAKQDKKKQAAPPAPQLYNLDSDIGESRNVAAQNPDVVKRLQAIVAAADADLGTSELGPGVRELGRAKNAAPILDHEGNVRSGFKGTKPKFP